MLALTKTAHQTQLISSPIPTPTQDLVRVRVSYVGICRTDIYIAKGLIPVQTPRVLGHEVSGTIDQTGPLATKWQPGQPVGIMPIVPCQHCTSCQNDDPLVCLNPKMLGMDLDGAFAQYVLVPSHCLYPLPETLDMKLAAYLEPICASMAILQAPITPSMRGAIFGDNRIAQLTQTILHHHGFEQVQIVEEATPNQFDFCVETIAKPEVLQMAIEAVKPRGVIILKSRPAHPVGIDFRAALQKELTFRATQYAPMNDAIAFATKHPHAFDHLLGPTFPLSDYEAVFASDEQHGDRKLFFDPWG